MNTNLYYELLSIATAGRHALQREYDIVQATCTREFDQAAHNAGRQQSEVFKRLAERRDILALMLFAIENTACVHQ